MFDRFKNWGNSLSGKNSKHEEKSTPTPTMPGRLDTKVLTIHIQYCGG
jgi:hypothetical protein